MYSTPVRPPYQDPSARVYASASNCSNRPTLNTRVSGFPPGAPSQYAGSSSPLRYNWRAAPSEYQRLGQQSENPVNDVEAVASVPEAFTVTRCATAASRWSSPSGRRDPAPVIGPGHRLHSADPAGVLFPDHSGCCRFPQKPQPMPHRKAAWLDKPSPTFVDAMALVRRHLWLASEGFSMSAAEPDIHKLPANLYHRLVDSLAYAA